MPPPAAGTVLREVQDFLLAKQGGAAPLCMEHLRELGATYVQLLPVFDFASVDEGGQPGAVQLGL